MADDLKAVARRPILGDKAQRYNRATMLLGLVLAALHLTSLVNFDHLSIFGVQIGESVASKRAIALTVLWLALIYNFAWGAYLSSLDWRRWKSDLLDRWGGENQDFFPELRMYWWTVPTLATAEKRYAGRMGGFRGWTITREGNCIDYLVRRSDGKGGEIHEAGFRVSKSVVAEVREQVWMLLPQLAPPALSALAALAGLISETVRTLL